MAFGLKALWAKLQQAIVLVEIEVENFPAKNEGEKKEIADNQR